MSEDIPDESLPGDVSLGMNSLSIDNNPETATKDDETKGDKQKVVVLLKATGNAPIIKKQRWAVDPEKPVGWIMEFVRKFLKLEPSEKLFLYVNQTFAPSPDQLVRNLYECFGANGKLILHYCKSQAWG